MGLVLRNPMAVCLMFKAEVNRESLEADHVEKTAIDVGRDRNSILDIKRRAFGEKILALQRLAESGQPMVVVPKKVTFQVRVAKVRARCRRHFRNGFKKLELTEHEISERRHALAQKLIAKTLRQADRRRPRRRVKINALCFRRLKISITSFSPIMSCIRWLRQPFLRLERLASLAASKVELRKYYTSRVTCFPLDENLVPLLSVCEAC